MYCGNDDIYGENTFEKRGQEAQMNYHCYVLSTAGPSNNKNKMLFSG